MKPIAARDELAHARSISTLSLIINVLLAAITAVVLFKYFGAVNGEKIVQQTFDGDKSRWISESGPSRQKLVETGYWIAHLTQDLSPTSIPLNTELLQQWVDPLDWATLKQKSEKQAEVLAGMKAAQVFNPTSYAIDMKKLRIAVIGELRQTISEVALPPQMKSYMFEFKQVGLMLKLKDWHESSKDNPTEFLDPKQQEEALKAAAAKAAVKK